MANQRENGEDEAEHSLRIDCTFFFAIVVISLVAVLGPQGAAATR